MTHCRKLNCLYFVVFCLFSYTNICLSQIPISGKVYDLKRNGLDSCLVKIASSDGKIIKSFITDKAGFWHGDLSPGGYIICFSADLFRDTCYNIRVISHDVYLETILHSNSIFLDEIKIVSNEAVMRSGDTVFYNKKYFENSFDKSIGDIISRIPDFTWDKNGDLLYKGQKLKEFTLDGFNIFDRNYQSLNTTIQKDVVNTIEVVKNEKENGEYEYALNLGVSQSSKNKILGELELGSNINRTYLVLSPYILSSKVAISSSNLFEVNLNKFTNSQGDFAIGEYMKIFTNPSENFNYVRESGFDNSSYNDCTSSSSSLNMNFKNERVNFKFNWKGQFEKNTYQRVFDRDFIGYGNVLSWRLAEYSSIGNNYFNIDCEIKEGKKWKLSIKAPVAFIKQKMTSLFTMEKLNEAGNSIKNWRKNTYNLSINGTYRFTNNIANQLIVSYLEYNLPAYLTVFSDSVVPSINQFVIESGKKYLILNRTYLTLGKFNFYNNIIFERIDKGLMLRNSRNTQSNFRQDRLLERLVGNISIKKFDFTAIFEYPLYYNIGYNGLKANFRNLNSEFNLKYSFLKDDKIFCSFKSGFIQMGPIEMDTNRIFQSFNELCSGSVPLTSETQNRSISLGVFSLSKVKLSYSFFTLFNVSLKPLVLRFRNIGENIYQIWQTDSMSRSGSFTFLLSGVNKLKHSYWLSLNGFKSLNIINIADRASSYGLDFKINWAIPVRNKFNWVISAGIIYDYSKLREAILSRNVYNLGNIIKGRYKKMEYKVEYLFSVNNIYNQAQNFGALNITIGHLLFKDKVSLFLCGYNILNFKANYFANTDLQNNELRINLYRNVPLYALFGFRYVR